MRFQVWPLLCLLGHLLPLTLAGGEAGCMEKMYAEHCYNIFQLWFKTMDDAGEIVKPKKKPPKGSKKLPFDTGTQDIMFKKGRSKTAANSGWGKGEFGGYDFKEFMDETRGFELGRCTVDPPGPGRDYLTVAKELDAQGYGGETKVQKIASSLGNSYPEMLKKLFPLVTQARARLGDEALRNSHLNEMEDLLRDISTIRTKETAPWIIKDFKERFGITPEITPRSDDRLNLNWDEIDWVRTYEAHGGAIDKFGPGKVQQWFENYGESAKDPFSGDPKLGYSSASTQHWTVRNAVWSAQTELRKTHAECVATPPP